MNSGTPEATGFDEAQALTLTQVGAFSFPMLSDYATIGFIPPPIAQPAMAKQPATHAEIYELIDPRDGSVRYIGKATNSARRLKGHLREVRRVTPLYQWIAKLRTMGMSPTMRVRQVCQIDQWMDAERAAIAQGRAEGLRLLNVAEGGDEPFCSTEVRAANARKVTALRASDPVRMKIYNAKRALGTALKLGYVAERTKVKMRLAAAKRPDLFGEWANV